MPLSIPDVGDAAKCLCTTLGIEEESADYLAAGVCLAVGDTQGAYDHAFDCIDNITDSLQGIHPPRTVTAYPAPDDVEGWKQWIQEHGYQAFIDAYKAGAVDDAVLSDPGFMLVMQDEKSQYTAAMEFRSNLLASEDRLRQLISQNLRG